MTTLSPANRSSQQIKRAGAVAVVATSWIVSRVGIFETDSMTCPFGEHSPSNSTDGAFLR